MKGKKLIMLAMVIVLLVALPAVALAAGKKAKSTATPPTKIEAKFKFEDKGMKKGLKITGTAKGLAPDHSYLSLIYGLGSEVKGIHACEPNEPNTLGSRMLVGFWTVAADGTATLGPVVKKGKEDYVALKEIGTISVRGGVPAGKGTIVVMVCGEVK